MKSLAPGEFGGHYTRLPELVQTLARKTFAVFQRTSFHPLLHFKPVAGGYLVRARRPELPRTLGK